MRLSNEVAEQATRHYNLAVMLDFVKGRSSRRVAAACLYIACRYAKSKLMLIDFSDKLRVSIFLRSLSISRRWRADTGRRLL
jgi:transcription factor IIIB subunit 2